MYEINTDLHIERLKDIKREQDNIRLAKSAKRSDQFIRRARKSLGQGLVNVGKHIIGE